jgi:hypothetical protein
MKLITITLLSASYQNAQGFSPLTHHSALTTFPPTLTMPSEYRNRKAQPSSIMSSPTSTQLHYGNDPSHSRGDNQSPQQSAQQKLKTGFWNALEHTETWMSNILKNSTKENPIARNEVSYECEMNQGTLACIAGIFRRFKEAREMGTRYERGQKQMAKENRYYDVEPMRRTQVVILPFCDFFDQFASYDRITRAITNARVIAQHLITDLAVENLEKESAGFKRDQDWDINVSGATLHPDYTTPQELVDQMKNSGDSNANDSNKDREKLIQEQKNRARQSPYPTLIIEVKAFPQPTVKPTVFEGDETMVDIIFKLEAIYAKSAALHKKSETKTEDIFYHAIGMLNGIEEILPSNMIEVVENWVVDNDRRYDADLSTFASSNLKHADSAYEFVFANLALHKFIPDDDEDDDGGGGDEKKTYTAGLRSYLIMPKFVSTSATSFEKFAGGVNEIVRSIDGLKNRMIVSIMHPEHVDDDKRSPAPVLVLQWYEQK